GQPHSPQKTGGRGWRQAPDPRRIRAGPHRPLRPPPRSHPRRSGRSRDEGLRGPAPRRAGRYRHRHHLRQDPRTRGAADSVPRLRASRRPRRRGASRRGLDARPCALRGPDAAERDPDAGLQGGHGARAPRRRGRRGRPEVARPRRYLRLGVL
ncbi:MAG: hypothetical protein AVDCRST_MAG12-3323, partial [uncultured Rubrobacteraceae bacterium]